MQVTTTVGAVIPTSSLNQLVLDKLDDAIGASGAPQADLFLAGVSATNGNDVGLSFQSSAIGGLAAGFAMPATFNTFVNAGIGVAVSADGVSWTRVKDLSTSSTSYSLSRLNLSLIAAAAGIPLTANFRVRFQGQFSAALPSQGLAFDNLQISVLKAVGIPAAITVLPGIATGPLSNVAAFTDDANPVGTYIPPPSTGVMAYLPPRAR